MSELNILKNRKIKDSIDVKQSPEDEIMNLLNREDSLVAASYYVNNIDDIPINLLYSLRNTIFLAITNSFDKIIDDQDNNNFQKLSQCLIEYKKIPDYFIKEQDITDIATKIATIAVAILDKNDFWDIFEQYPEIIIASYDKIELGLNVEEEVRLLEKVYQKYGPQRYLLNMEFSSRSIDKYSDKIKIPLFESYKKYKPVEILRRFNQFRSLFKDLDRNEQDYLKTIFIAKEPNIVFEKIDTLELNNEMKKMLCDALMERGYHQYIISEEFLDKLGIEKDYVFQKLIKNDLVYFFDNRAKFKPTEEQNRFMLDYICSDPNILAKVFDSQHISNEERALFDKVANNIGAFRFFGKSLDVESIIEQNINQEIDLENGEIRLESVNKLIGGSNGVYLYDVGEFGKGVFKPKSEEEPDLRLEVKAGSYFLRERASYIVDRYLGFGLVPATVIRSINNEIGSLQMFKDIKKADQGSESEYYLSQEYLDSLYKLFFFDFLTFNSDRHHGNILTDYNRGQIIAIDNGLSFGNESIFSDTLKCNWESRLSGKAPSEDMLNTIIDSLNRVIGQEYRDKLISDIADLVGYDEATACMARISKLSDILKDITIKEALADGNINRLFEVFNYYGR